MSSLWLLQDHEGEKAGAQISRSFHAANDLCRRGIAVRCSEVSGPPVIPEVVIPSPMAEPEGEILVSEPAEVMEEEQPRRRRKKKDEHESESVE